MWNTVEANRRLYVGTVWLLYGISRTCYFLGLRYNRTTQQLEELQPQRVVSKLVLVAKCLLLAKEVVFYLVLGAAVWIHVVMVDDSIGQNFLISLLVELNSIYVLRRLVLFLHSQSNRRLLQQLVNEMFAISRIVAHKYGLIYHCPLSLLGLYACKLLVLCVLLDAMWYKDYVRTYTLIYFVLLEYCLLGYFVYQLTVLNWHRSCQAFLQRFIDHHSGCNRIGGYYHRRLLWLFKLQIRINALHQRINSSVSWLPCAVYLSILSCIMNMALLLECVIFAGEDIETKLYIMADGCLGRVLVPLLNILILAICTDSLRTAELMLQQQIVIINVLYVRKGTLLNEHTLKLLYNEHTSLIVHQKLEPLLNVIILDTIWDREFAFDFFITVVGTALSFIQYTISSDRLLKECVTSK